MAITWDPLHTQGFGVLSNGNETITCGTRTRTVGIAIDIDNKLIWMFNPYSRRDGWNADFLSAQNPATGRGGIAWTATTPVTPCWATLTTNNQATANFGGTEFVYNPPTGFSAWDLASGWDPGHVGANISLSGTNLVTAAATAGGSGWRSVLNTTTRSTGKWYFELNTDVYGAGSGYMMIGIANLSQALNSYPGSTASTGFGIANDGTVYPSGTSPIAWGGTPPGTGTRVGTLATLGHGNGKWYFEITQVLATGECIAGISTYLAELTAYMGMAVYGDGAGMQQSSGAIYVNGFTGLTYGTWATGDTIDVAVDLNAKRIWFRVPSTGLWNANATYNPATGIGGIDISPINGSPVYPAVSSVFTTTTSSQFTGRLNGAEMIHAIPAGFLPWDVAISDILMGQQLTW